MLLTWGSALLSMAGASIVYVVYDLPDPVYVVLYFVALAIPLSLMSKRGAGAVKAGREGKADIAQVNILPRESKRTSKAPIKFRASIGPDVPAPKEQAFVPEAVRKKDKMNGVTVYEIKWVGLSESQNTWAAPEGAGADVKKLIADFEASSPVNEASPLKSSRRSVNKIERKGLWPPAEAEELRSTSGPTSAPKKPAPKNAPQKMAPTTKPANKENAAPTKSPRKTRSRSSSISRANAKSPAKAAAPTAVVVSPKKTRSRSSSVSRANAKSPATKAVSKGSAKASPQKPSPRRTRRSAVQ